MVLSHRAVIIPVLIISTCLVDKLWAHKIKKPCIIFAKLDFTGGDKENRTPDLLTASQTL